MEGNVRYISEYLRGAPKLIIPVYQRNYDWQKENCKRLIDDLVSLHEEGKQTHFFGSIVVKPGDYSQDIVIIDGQQRITTISLLILAMKNYMMEHNITQQTINPYNLNDSFLINSFSNDADKQKLKPNPRDFEAYKRLYSDPRTHIQTSNITINYDYFYQQLGTLHLTLEELFQSINKLQVMVVNLNSPDDDPQLIFESLNSTGVDLTNADKIRNFLLMNEDQSSQQELFNNYWQPIEERTHLKMSDFFKDYLTLKEGKTPVIAKVYEAFADFYNKLEHKNEKKPDVKKEFFKELAEYSIAYEHTLKSNTNNKEINEFLKRIEEINVTVAKPFILAILKDYSDGKMDAEEIIRIFRLVESYIARRLITALPSNTLNKIFATLYKDLRKHMTKTEGNVAESEIIAYLLLSKTSTGRFPDDREVEESLKSRNMYNISPKIRTYIFERLENHGHVENLNIFEGVQNQDYSVEHIMPQTLSSEWKKELGENHEELHDLYLNSIGNLTLTGYNSKYSNRPFREKQNIEKGFKDSHFAFLNRLPAVSESWGEAEIIRRRNDIIKRSLDIWKYPDTTYEPISTKQEMVIFDGTQTFKNYYIKGYTFLDDNYVPIDTWKAMMIEIVKSLAEKNVNPLLELAKLNQSGLDLIFSTEPHEERVEIIPGIYMYVSYSNSAKMKYLMELFDIYEIDYEELTVDIIRD
ncbi:DUF262 domain-containing protein [Lacicoccus alkaliphilus]|uniref:Uncharacterized conserved protein, contains ParB-like and HNH nuclease domains n=1 Tax=Lacicoccus alkaliphilus DSM 16010 TaxID=1123231 RepID=A0A1M7IT30_9BACL|nr:DUF262 domain-containing protein [Salinicoccus alkaliphilus]SHM43783.1 Uncharacterized conserved protein, contains ParB-like and HNH nuclease domains [Salinicoccus alkaliphilus DSM 16010]